MASASSLLSEDQFLCSICLDVFTDPVSTPCGHNYCKACITQNWDSSDVCKCPLCNKTFYGRPEIFINTFISEMADKFRKTLELKRSQSANREAAKPDEVSCDICEGTKIKAVKTCLVCLTSYCETHLEPHQTRAGLKRHKLINPVKNLEDLMCQKHDRPLEMFCKTDCVCVCQSCTDSDHKFHRIVTLEEECEERKAELEKTEAEVQQMIQERREKIEEAKRSVELSRREADAVIAESVQVFTATISSIERCQAELIDGVEEKQKTTEKQAEEFIRELQQEITQLEKRSSELRQFAHSEDHLHLLQNLKSNTAEWRPTKDWTKANVHQASLVGILRTAVSQLEKTLSQGVKQLCGVELRKVQQYEVDVTLDQDTAHIRLILSEDRKQVSEGKLWKCLRKNWHLQHDYTERFSTVVSVLGKQGFSSGRFYYEVQVKGKTEWDVGVARESINRKEEITMKPNNGFWTIGLRDENEYLADEDPLVILSVKEKLQTVGVFVDHEEGLVSFYDVETRVHLYSFTGCSFTEKLFPYFSPCFNDGGRNSAPLIITPVKHTD